MKRIFSIMRIDLRLIFRDKIALYMVLSPVLLTLVFVAMTGRVSSGGVTLAVSKDVPVEIVQRLALLCDVVLYDDPAELWARVLRADNAAGVEYANGQPGLVLEGNEPADYTAKVQLLLSSAQQGELPVYRIVQVESKNSSLTRVTGVLLLLFAVFIAGAAAGFSIVAERESRAAMALAIAPLGLARYAAARGLTAFGFAAVNVTLCALVMGKAENLPLLLTAVVCALPMLALTALLLGTAAANQIAAVGTIKLLMPAFMIVPIGSLFVPDRLQFLFYWLPNYWLYVMFDRAWNGGPIFSACALSVGVCLAFLILLYRTFGRRLQLR